MPLDEIDSVEPSLVATEKPPTLGEEK